MQEVEGFLSSDLNYANLKGDTGPLVRFLAFFFSALAFALFVILD
jgi:hypothetical protein